MNSTEKILVAGACGFVGTFIILLYKVLYIDLNKHPDYFAIVMISIISMLVCVGSALNYIDYRNKMEEL